MPASELSGWTPQSRGDIPSDNTTRVYLLLKAIAAKALPQQLPVELRGLR
ncbi:MAG TPA: hypothetical protein VN924_24500 [Bryobacteraceae bacterium]|nr:hypothetical protein [Bryobacteraceae bacterium]